MFSEIFSYSVHYQQIEPHNFQTATQIFKFIFEKSTDTE